MCVSKTSPWQWWRFGCHCVFEAPRRDLNLPVSYAVHRQWSQPLFCSWLGVVFSLVSLQSGRVFGGMLTGYLKVMEMKPGWTGGAFCMLKASLSELQILLHPILCSPLPHCSHCLPPSLLGAEQDGRAQPLRPTGHLVAVPQSVVISHSVVGLIAERLTEFHCLRTLIQRSYGWW